MHPPHQRGNVLVNMIATGLSVPTQSGVGIAAVTVLPMILYEIGQKFKELAKDNPDGKLTEKQQAAHVLAHAVLGAAVAVASGNDALAAAPYISKWLYGKEKGSDLTAEEKETVSAITNLLGTATGAAVGNSATDAAQGSLNVQSAVENNFLYSQTAKNKHWLSQEEINVLNTLAKQAGARSLEYFIGEEQKIRQSSLNNIEKEAALIRLKRAYESDSHKMEIAASKLPRGSKERGILFNIASKMQGVLFAIPPYEKSEFIRAEQRDWLPTSNFIHTGNSGFVAVQKQWVINDGGTLEDAQFQTSMPIGGRAVGNGSRGGKVLPSVGRKLPSVEVASTPSVPKMERGGGSRLATRERVNRNIQETRRGNQSSQFGTHAQRERVLEQPVTANGQANAVSYSGLKLDLKTTQAANEVVESLRKTGKLPTHYITKINAEMHGWQSGKALNNYVIGAQIGGDVFKNNQKIVPEKLGRTWYEADIGVVNTQSRSKQSGTRLIYSSDGLLYITNDHYKTVKYIGNWK